MNPADQFRAMMNTRAISCQRVADLVPEWSLQYVRMLRKDRATQAHVEKLRRALGFGVAVAPLQKMRDDGCAGNRLSVIRAAALG